MSQSIEVSVVCTVYNHEKYLRKCLDGFVSQKTTFRVEYLIHDDCSTDRSAIIIAEYARKYPSIIIPFYEDENQHSKGVKIIKQILFPYVRGKYLAICEGDDFWSDDQKLQKQYNYMEAHPECSLCVHNTKMHDLLGKRPDKKFNNWDNIHILTEKECFFGWNVHTSSYFMRYQIEKNRPDFINKYWFGDYCMLTWDFDSGEVVALPDIMSVYNYNNQQGVTYKKDEQVVEDIIKKDMQRCEYLKEYNEYTKGRHQDIVNERIQEIEFSCLKIKQDNIMRENNSSIAKEAALQIFNHPYFYKYLKQLKIKDQIASIIKYRYYNIYALLKGKR